MTDQSKNHEHEQRTAKWIRGLPPAEPDESFRKRLRSQFVSGEFETADAERKAQPSPRLWWRWAVPVAAAVAVLVAVGFFNRGPSLRVLDLAGSGEVRINGQATTLGDGQILRPGAEIDVPDDETVDLIVQGIAVYEVAAGTRMTLPATPGRWFNRAVACSLFAGELRLKTGEDFAGSELRVYTPDGIVEVTATLLSVQCDLEGTCVCVLEGVARVGVDAQDLEPVTPEDGTVEIIPVKPMHRDGVLEFNERVGGHLGDG
jgi:ferric-dicitrate binding protein FerR (iron transport regulator)